MPLPRWTEPESGRPALHLHCSLKPHVPTPRGLSSRHRHPGGSSPTRQETRSRPGVTASELARLTDSPPTPDGQPAMPPDRTKVTFPRTGWGSGGVRSPSQRAGGGSGVTNRTWAAEHDITEKDPKSRTGTEGTGSGVRATGSSRSRTGQEAHSGRRPEPQKLRWNLLRGPARHRAP